MKKTINMGCVGATFMVLFDLYRLSSHSLSSLVRKENHPGFKQHEGE